MYMEPRKMVLMNLVEDVSEDTVVGKAERGRN